VIAIAVWLVADLIIAGVLCWAVRSMAFIPAPFQQAIVAVIVVVAVLIAVSLFVPLNGCGGYYQGPVGVPRR
jgi:hypothetical protein